MYKFAFALFVKHFVVIRSCCCIPADHHCLIRVAFATRYLPDFATIYFAQKTTISTDGQIHKILLSYIKHFAFSYILLFVMLFDQVNDVNRKKRSINYGEFQKPSIQIAP